MITKNKMVSVSYELRTEQNGELLEAAGADRPRSARSRAAAR